MVGNLSFLISNTEKHEQQELYPRVQPSLLSYVPSHRLWQWLLSYGPGTAGSVVALLIWLVLLHWLSVGVLTVLTLVLVVLFTLVGTWATAKVQPFGATIPAGLW